MYYTPSPSPPATPPSSDSECESVTPLNVIQSISRADLVSTPPHPHPLAASAKANRPPPDYEKKLVTPPTTPPELSKHLKPAQTRDSDVDTDISSLTRQPLPFLADTEQKRWDIAISSTVDKAETTLDLSNTGLTYIPTSIIDLKGLVVLPRNQRTSTSTPRTFMRSMTTPATLPSSHIRPFLPSHSTNRLELKPPGQWLGNIRKPMTERNGCEIELYLMRNAIRVLPRELFALDRLVVLSLRQNKLTSLPSAICRLTRLRELNIANNRLSHLPAEIQDLRLSLLHLYPNPFTPPPLKDQRHKTKHIRTLGPLKHGPPVPTLSELALRHLLSPPRSTSIVIPAGSKSCLEDSMSLAEIDALPLPPHAQRIIRASTGHSQARLTEEGTPVDAELDMTMNLCPSPHHCLVRSGIASKKSVRFVPNGHQVKRGLFDPSAPVFRVPVEERMEWVGTVAGVQVAESPNAWVPLLWRGCGSGCLDFLEDGEEGISDENENIFGAGSDDEVDEFHFSDDES